MFVLLMNDFHSDLFALLHGQKGLVRIQAIMSCAISKNRMPVVFVDVSVRHGNVLLHLFVVLPNTLNGCRIAADPVELGRPPDTTTAAMNKQTKKQTNKQASKQMNKQTQLRSPMHPTCVVLQRDMQTLICFAATLCMTYVCLYNMVLANVSRSTHSSIHL